MRLAPSTSAGMQEVIPAAMRWSFGLAAAAALAFVAWSTQRSPDTNLVAAVNSQASTENVLRALRFVDAADGSVRVIDARSDVLIETLVGEEGFVRSTVRGLAMERRRQGIGPETPFLLVRRPDGGVNFEDPTTGRKVSLEAFGSTNAAAFKRLLADGPAPNKIVQ